MNTDTLSLASSLTWIPSIPNITSSIELIHALRDPTRLDHQMAMTSLESNATNPSFVLAILFIFSRGNEGILVESMQGNISSDVRQLAGLIIKNFVFPKLYDIDGSVQQIIKTEILHVVLHETTTAIRHTGAILIGKFSESYDISTWSDILLQLLNSFEITLLNDFPILIDGTLQSIKQICEDSCNKLALDDVNRPLDILVPKLSTFLTCQESSVRIRALQCYNSLLYLLDSHTGTNLHASVNQSRRNSSFDDVSQQTGSSGTTTTASSPHEPKAHKTYDPSNNTSVISPAIGIAAYPLVTNMTNFIQILAQLSSDNNTEVRASVCESLTIIANVHVAMLEPFFSEICQFMLTTLLDTEEKVSIASCEYWIALLHNPSTKNAMIPYLSALIVNLITRLVLTEEQMEEDRIDDEEEHTGEKELNLRPIHYRPSTNNAADDNQKSSNNDDFNATDSGLSSKWTLRRQAGLTLDLVAVSFPADDILVAALPKIQENFTNDSVIVQESGMLALGALSTGCFNEMLSYLPQLFPFLINNLSNELPEMRSISCWVLSRYCGLFSEDKTIIESNNRNNEIQEFVVTQGSLFYEETLLSLLRTMNDDKPKVQVAAGSALCLLVENSFTVSHISEANIERNILNPHLPVLLTVLNNCFQNYGVKSSLILIDTIGTLADTVGQVLCNPAYTPLYFPNIIQKFNELDDFDMRMFPLLECLGSVISVIGLETKEHIGTIYMRCLKILNISLKECDENNNQLSNNHHLNLSDLKDYAVCALDVISAISEGLGDSFITLIESSSTQSILFELLFIGLNSIHYPLVIQSGFSLAGEMCRNAFSLINHEIASNLIELSIIHLNPEYPLICNNVSWTIGELGMRVGGDFMRPYMNRLILGMIEASHIEDIQDTLKVNIGVTFGRLGVTNTAEVAEVADEFFADWCSFLSCPCPINEKTEGFSGLIEVLKTNPAIILGNKTAIYSFVLACASWSETPPSVEVAQDLQQIILGIQTNDSRLWGK
eukprot:gene8586-11601_t